MSDVDQFCELPSGIRLCYRTDGPKDGRPLLLIAGLALDLTVWPASLVSAVVDSGFFVIRFDNRDAGRSTHVATAPPSTLRQALARPRPEDYDLGAMADDTVALLDELGIDTVDLVGMSMGGMIAQVITARFPTRVRSLTSIISTTGNPRVGQPAWSTLIRMARPASRTADVSVSRHLTSLQRLDSPYFTFDAATEERWAREVWERGGGRAASAGAARQIAAIQKSGDRTEQLKTITAPTLVIHGDRDTMVNPNGGDATASAIPGARRVTVAGMRHHIGSVDPAHLAQLITEHAQSAKKVG